MRGSRCPGLVALCAALETLGGPYLNVGGPWALADTMGGPGPRSSLFAERVPHYLRALILSICVVISSLSVFICLSSDIDLNMHVTDSN